VVNNTIVHRGVPIERVSAASRVPVPRATVRDLPAGSARMPSRTASVVYRPQLQAPARPVNMVAQKVDAGHPVIQHAPIAPVRSAQPSNFSRSGSAPVATPRQPPVAAPKTSTWSSGAKPSGSTQPQSAPRTSESTHAAPSTATTARSSEQRKPATSAAPGNWPETGSPGGSKSSSPAPSTASTKPAPAQDRNSPLYHPKGYYQTPSRSHSSSDTGSTGSSHSPGNSPESHSKNSP
jgi:hypothetical protein